MKTDEDLMLAYAQQDNISAFKTLYKRYRSLLYRYLLRQVANEATTEELFQDIWANIIHHRHHYQPCARFRTYLFTIARRRLIDHIRKQNNQPLTLDSSEIELQADNKIRPDNQAEQHFAGQKILNALKQLPEKQKEVFVLKAEANFSLQEIANLIGENQETVKSRYRYAIQRLKVLLEASL